MRLVQEVVALHLAPAGLLNDLPSRADSKLPNLAFSRRQTDQAASPPIPTKPASPREWVAIVLPLAICNRRWGRPRVERFGECHASQGLLMRQVRTPAG